MLETVVILHSSSILHADLSCSNFFLDQNLDIKGGDFAGSPIDGEKALVCYETRSSHPGLVGVTCESEIFALGSCLYEVMAGFKSYPELTDSEIEQAYSRGSEETIDPISGLRSYPTAIKTAALQS